MPDYTLTEARRALDSLVRAQHNGELAKACERRGIRLLVLFGSAVNWYKSLAGGQSPDLQLRPRDVDIALMLNRSNIPLIFVEAVSELTRLVRSDALDPMQLDHATPVALNSVAMNGVPLYQDDKLLFANFQLRAWSLYEDSTLYRESIRAKLSKW